MFSALFNGRINRISYFIGYIAFSMTSYFLAIIGAIVGNEAFSDLLTLIVISLVILTTISLYSRRIHDLGYSSWGLILLFVPFFNCMLLLALLFVSGQDKANSYGP